MLVTCTRSAGERARLEKSCHLILFTSSVWFCLSSTNTVKPSLVFSVEENHLLLEILIRGVESIPIVLPTDSKVSRKLCHTFALLRSAEHNIRRPRFLALRQRVTRHSSTSLQSRVWKSLDLRLILVREVGTSLIII